MHKIAVPSLILGRGDFELLGEVWAKPHWTELHLDRTPLI